MRILIQGILILTSVLLSSDTTVATQLPITVSQNGYSGLTVAISNSISENVALIQKLKDWITAASRVLYKASKYQLYYKDVAIVLPKTWSIQSSYKKISGLKFSMAHVRIDEENPVVGKVPYVFGQTECGKPGQYMHLTTYLLFAGELAGFGEIGDVFVHEWGHLRWGLYDEYASFEEAGLESPSAFYLDDGTWKPTRCTEEVTGRNINMFTGAPCTVTEDGIPEKDCVFIADKDSPATASLMGQQNVLKMEEFCDTDESNTDSKLRHNSQAANNQNIKCNSRSAWEVMRKHDDFKGNTPGSPSFDTTPDFTIEVETDQRICLLLDISGSMQKNNRNSKMYTAASNFLLNMVADGTSVGVATFNNIGRIVHQMLTISSQSDRQQLVASLPTTTGGTTSIGAGLLACITALNSSSDGLEGSMIFLVTDGEESRAPYIADVQPVITTSGVIVNTLALGNESDTQLGGISRASGGQSFYYSEDEDSTVLTDAFAAAVADSSSDTLIQIESKSFSISSTQSFEHYTTIDATVGRDTIVQISSSEGDDIDISVTGPDQTIYKEINSTFGITTVKIPNIAQSGSYKVSVTTTSNSIIPGVLNVQSKVRVPGETTAKLSVWLSDDTHVYGSDGTTVVYVAVLKGMAPVLKCDVTASLEGYEASTIQLHDNGIGSDSREYDGIYSAYIFSNNFKRNGRHSLKISGQNINNRAETLKSKEKSDTFPYYSGLTTELVGNFQRVILSSEISVTNYSTTQLTDNIKPAKITTLKLKSVQLMGDKLQIILLWKAIGDDLDVGTASEYEFRISDSFSKIKQQPEQCTKLTNNIPIPKLAGSTEQHLVTKDDDSLTKYIVVRAIDDVGNKGDYSNIVSISKLTDPSWTTEAISTVNLTETFVSGGLALAILLIMMILGLCLKVRSSNTNDKKKLIKQKKHQNQKPGKRGSSNKHHNRYEYENRNYIV
ncbi:calcium-activated chloride channel regulator 1-like isoform X1 [Mytilus californianus]|uniref:calcium-activated chloride channel regulator 1-like isoform X1 n=1 Tax=Mytilus californianus TaxID=6549 RepID=UPI002245554B|nr:calcium-activated chloride channel regulator 1-like isoform X1 [Mytilus californianus]